MLYRSLTSSLANNSVQNLFKNLGSQSIINFLDRPQSIRSNCLRKAYVYYSADQVSAPLIRMTCFKNLYITNMIVLNPCLVSRSASTKSHISIKKNNDRDFIGYRDP